MSLSQTDATEAIKRAVLDTIDKTWDNIEYCFDRDHECVVPLKLILSASGPNGQVDITVKAELTTNLDEKPAPFKPDKVTAEKRIRLNPYQKQLPGQEN